MGVQTGFSVAAISKSVRVWDAARLCQGEHALQSERAGLLTDC